MFLGDMADYFIYAYADTGYFAKISDRALTNSSLIAVPVLPPDKNHRWDGQAWVALTNTEIETIISEAEEEEPKPAFESLDIVTPTSTINNSLVFWGNERGDRLINSEIKLQSATLQFPYNLNLIDKNYLINGKRINPEKDRQKIIRIDQKNYSENNWQLIPDMQLISANLEPAFYKIEIEILAKVSKNNRDFEFALFVNGNQQENNLLHIDFNKANDDKSLSWSDELELEPNSIVALFWRRVGSNVNCTVGRRKLAIAQQQSSGLSELS